METRVPIEELLRHSGWLRALAARLVNDSQGADDLVQETWLAALRRPPRAGESSVPWLARVVRNLARNARRDARTRREYEADGSLGRSPATPEAIAQEVEMQRRLVEAVASLTEPARSVIVLGYFRGLDSARVGAELGLAPSTVRTHHAQALAKLRERLDREHGGRRAWVVMLAPLAGVERGAWGVPAILASKLLAGLVAAAALAGAWIAWPRSCGAARPEGGTPEFALGPPASAPAEVREFAPASSTPERLSLVPVEEVATPQVVRGRVWLDDQPASLKLVLRFPGARSEPTFVRSASDGTFEAPVGSQPWCALAAPGYRFKTSIAAEVVNLPARAPVELRFVGGPILSGRILTPITREPIQAPVGAQGFNGYYEFTRGREGRSREGGVFATDDEGRFRLALLDEYTDEIPRARVHVECNGLGRIVVDAPPIGPEGLDLGDLELIACTSVPFRLLDAGGAVVEGGFAQHLDWEKYASNDDSGRGTLPCIPAEGARIRFASPRHRDELCFVQPAESPTVVLERTNVLTVRVAVRSGVQMPRLELALSPHEELLIDTGDPWDNVIVRGYGRTVASKNGPDAYFHVGLSPVGTTEVLLRDLRPDFLFRVQLLWQGEPLLERTCSLAAGEWQELLLEP